MTKRTKKAKPAVLPIRSLHPDVRAKALELAGGDPTRVQVVGRTEALVR
ncbi:MAG TPA: hypothetical protein VK204_12280 [Nocardioidaceae bacterium]|nr:hypothetical protein [Nocardioidaceae bacterium]